MGILQMVGHGHQHALFNVLHRRFDAQIGRIAFGRGCNVHSRLRQRERAFRHPDPLHRLICRGRDHDSAGIGVAHILACRDHDPAGNEKRILSGIDHLRHPIERCIGIAPPHALDECGNGIVMFILVIDQRFLLDRLLGRGEIVADNSVRGRARSKARRFRAHSARAGHRRWTWLSMNSRLPA